MLNSKRLLEITKFIDEEDFVADIGADHGKLIIEIANKYKNNKYLAVENKIGPFNNLKNSVENYNFNKNIECSLSDGIEYLPDHINTLVLSGMGGFNVINIIQKSLKNLKNVKKIIYSVHRNPIELEFFLKSYGYLPIESSAVHEHGQFYNIVCTKLNKKHAFIQINDQGDVTPKEFDAERFKEILKDKNKMSEWSNLFDSKIKETQRKLSDTYIRTGFIDEN